MDRAVYIPHFHLRAQDQTSSSINQLHGAVSLRRVTVTLLLIKPPPTKNSCFISVHNSPQCLKPCATFHNMLVSYSDELLAPCASPNLQDNPLSAQWLIVQHTPSYHSEPIYMHMPCCVGNEAHFCSCPWIVIRDPTMYGKIQDIHF